MAGSFFVVTSSWSKMDEDGTIWMGKSANKTRIFWFACGGGCGGKQGLKGLASRVWVFDVFLRAVQRLKTFFFLRDFVLRMLLIGENTCQGGKFATDSQICLMACIRS